MSPQKVVNILSVFNGFLGKIMPMICVAAMGIIFVMWSDWRAMSKTYASIPVVNDVLLRVGLMERDIGFSREQLDRMEKYLENYNIILGTIKSDVEKLKIYQGRQFRNK